MPTNSVYAMGLQRPPVKDEAHLCEVGYAFHVDSCAFTLLCILVAGNACLPELSYLFTVWWCVVCLLTASGRAQSLSVSSPLDCQCL